MFWVVFGAILRQLVSPSSKLEEMRGGVQRSRNHSAGGFGATKCAVQYEISSETQGSVVLYFMLASSKEVNTKF